MIPAQASPPGLMLRMVLGTGSFALAAWQAKQCSTKPLRKILLGIAIVVWLLSVGRFICGN